MAKKIMNIHKKVIIMVKNQQNQRLAKISHLSQINVMFSLLFLICCCLLLLILSFNNPIYI